MQKEGTVVLSLAIPHLENTISLFFVCLTIISVLTEHVKRELAIRREISARRYYLTHSALAPIQPPSGLAEKRGEYFYFETHADRYERRVRNGQSWSSARIGRRLLGFNVWLTKSWGHTKTRTVNACEDSGHLLISNQRCIFRGERKTLVIGLHEITGCRFKDDWFLIERENQDTLSFTVDDEFVDIVLRRVLGRRFGDQRPRRRAVSASIDRPEVA
jgi:hypothetical protein